MNKKVVNMSAKEQQKLVAIMNQLDRFAERELNDKDSSPHEKTPREQAIDLGLLQQLPEEFQSQYKILKSFLMAKKFEGCSIETIKGYYNILYNFISSMNLNILDAKTDDIRKYLMYYQETHNILPRSIEGMRRVFSSFYNWCVDEELVAKNPVNKLKKIRVAKVIKNHLAMKNLRG